MEDVTVGLIILFYIPGITFIVSPLFFSVDYILSVFSYSLQVNLMHFFVNSNQVLNTQKIDRSAIAQN